MKPPNPDWRILKDTDLKEPSPEEAKMFPDKTNDQVIGLMREMMTVEKPSDWFESTIEKKLAASCKELARRIMFPEEIVVEDGQQVMCADGHWRPASDFSKDAKLSAYNVETGETAPVKRITKETK